MSYLPGTQTRDTLEKAWSTSIPYLCENYSPFGYPTVGDRMLTV